MDWTNTTGADVESGQAVIIGNLVGVALVDIPDGGHGSVAVGEVFEIPITDGVAVAQGQRLYMDPATMRLVVDGSVSGAVAAGYAWEVREAQTGGTVPCRLTID